MSCFKLYSKYKDICLRAEENPPCDLDNTDNEYYEHLKYKYLRYQKCARLREEYRDRCIPEDERDEGHEEAIRRAKTKSYDCIKKRQELVLKREVSPKEDVIEEEKKIKKEKKTKKEKKIKKILSDEEIERLFEEENREYEEIYERLYDQIPETNEFNKYLILKSYILDTFLTNNITIDQLRSISNVYISDVKPLADIDFDKNYIFILVYLFEKNPYTRMYIPIDAKVRDIVNIFPTCSDEECIITDDRFRVLNMDRPVGKEIKMGSVINIKDVNMIDFLVKNGIEIVPIDYYRTITDLEYLSDIINLVSNNTEKIISKKQINSYPEAIRHILRDLRSIRDVNLKELKESSFITNIMKRDTKKRIEKFEKEVARSKELLNILLKK